MTDFLLVEQLHRMMGELPRPRLMYRKGIGMRGYFKIYRSFEEYTSADVFCEMDRSFPVRARFSALLGDGGTADTRRNIKGFAVRLYSGAGEYDVFEPTGVFYQQKQGFSGAGRIHEMPRMV